MKALINMSGKRSINQMPVLRRHAGLCAVERNEENELWALIVMLVNPPILLSFGRLLNGNDP